MIDYISRADALAVIQHCKDPVKGIQELPGVGQCNNCDNLFHSDGVKGGRCPVCGSPLELSRRME